MRGERWRGASIAGVIAVSLAVTGCGRLADRGESANTGPVTSDTGSIDDDARIDIDSLLDDAEVALRESERDAADGDAAAGVGDEP